MEVSLFETDFANRLNSRPSAPYDMIVVSYYDKVNGGLDRQVSQYILPKLYVP